MHVHGNDGFWAKTSVTSFSCKYASLNSKLETELDNIIPIIVLEPVCITTRQPTIGCNDRDRREVKLFQARISGLNFFTSVSKGSVNGDLSFAVPISSKQVYINTPLSTFRPSMVANGEGMDENDGQKVLPQKGVALQAFRDVGVVVLS